MKNIYNKLKDYDNPKYEHIANYVLCYNNPAELTTKLIQEKCHISASTITKFVHSLGFEHFQEMKYSLVFSKNSFTTIENNTLLPLFLNETIIESTTLVKEQFEKSETIFILSDLNNRPLAESLNNLLICSLDNKKEISYISSSVQFDKSMAVVKDNILVLFLGNMPANIIYRLPLNRTTIVNIGIKDDLTFKPSHESINYIIIDNIEENPLNKWQLLFFYIGFLAVSFCGTKQLPI